MAALVKKNPTEINSALKEFESLPKPESCREEDKSLAELAKIQLNIPKNNNRMLHFTNYFIQYWFLL